MARFAVTVAALPAFVWRIVVHLQRRGMPVGVDDCHALRQALAAGFGWSATAALCELCVALWAKSPAEADIVRAVFNRSPAPDWQQPAEPPPPSPAAPAPGPSTSDTPAPRPPTIAYVARPLGGLPHPPPHSGQSDPTLLLVPQYPVTEREVAQVWRRLRRPQRHGPAVEVDIDATIRRRTACGVATPPVLVPARRNTARLVLLLDRLGSMTPYHGFVDHIRRAIEHAGRLDSLTVVYFHDLPGHCADRW